METQPLLIKKGWLRALLFFFSFFIIVAFFDLIGILIVSHFSEYGFEEYTPLLQSPHSMIQLQKEKDKISGRKKKNKSGLLQLD